jgi:hypothetical protein
MDGVTCRADVEFRLTLPRADLYVDVRLRDMGGRWLAVADIAGDREIGLGRSAAHALAASVSSLGRDATAALLADISLLGVSRRVLSGGRTT